MMLSAKSVAMWRSIQVWCMMNPDKNAAVVTPEGAFVITFHPKKED